MQSCQRFAHVVKFLLQKFPRQRDRCHQERRTWLRLITTKCRSTFWKLDLKLPLLACWDNSNYLADICQRFCVFRFDQAGAFEFRTATCFLFIFWLTENTQPSKGSIAVCDWRDFLDWQLTEVQSEWTKAKAVKYCTLFYRIVFTEMSLKCKR